MLPNIHSFPVLCRPALPMDTADVMELSSHIWEGQDYIPYVWQDWLADQEGLFIVAEVSGRVVGLAKLTRLSSRDWFMEGLRVHPGWQNRGIASRLNDFQLEYWRKYGDGSLRLATASTNIIVHHICERNGFQRMIEYTPHVAPSLSDGVDEFELVDPSELPSVFEMANTSASFALVGRYLDLGWRWAKLDVIHLQQMIKEKHIWWWRGRQGLLGIWLDEDDDEQRPQISMAASEVNQLGELLLDYRRLAHRLGKPKVGWVAPIHPKLDFALHQAGFERSWDGALYLYELNK